MRKTTQALLAIVMALCMSVGVKAANYAWPAGHEGVMLQAFYWDSYSDTKWTNLTSQADELSQYFNLIWVPNSGRSAGSPTMGYMPVYWFTNHNSSFGSEAEIRNLISTYKAKGTGVIMDVVINHRAGVNDWADFPTETWNGQTWSIGLDGICSNDNLAGSGHGTPTGARDTGESFDGCRDLDHTNANVQNNCKNYCKFLIDDMGYAGFRLDMVKGYSGQYTKMYNEYAKPTYCVGEYWDGSYDAVASWIESTGKQSAAFDFPFKYAVNEAFSSGDMTKLVWLAEYKTPQPAGMIHHWYQQYAVTFIDNHDTYRDDWNKFNGNVVAANAFMLCSPGTPCVFLPHYKQNKAAIQTLINIRNSVGVSNTSAVTVLKSTNNCYMAEVTGSKGKLVVKVGSAMDSPDGYTNSDIKASGTDYCVWTKVNVQGGTTQGTTTTTGTAPSNLYLMGHISQGAWKTNCGVAMKKNGNKFTASSVTIVDGDEGEGRGYFSFVTALGSTGASSEWDEVINANDRYGATTKDAPISVGGSAAMKVFSAGIDASSANSWAIAPGTYDITADFDKMTISVVNAGQGGQQVDPEPEPETPSDKVYVYCDGHWNNVHAYIYNEGATVTENASWPGVAMTRDAATGYYKLQVPDNLKASCRVIFNTGVDGTDRYPADMEPGLPIAGKSMVYHIASNVWEEYTEKEDPTPDLTPDPEPGTYPDLYIVGYVYGINAPTDYKMECDADGVYTIAMDDLSGAFAIAGVGLNPFITTANREMELNIEYVCDSSEKALMYLPSGPQDVIIRYDYNTKKIIVTKNSGIAGIDTDTDETPIYYNLQGVRVIEPSTGIYIMVRGGNVSKVYVR